MRRKGIIHKVRYTSLIPDDALPLIAAYPYGDLRRYKCISQAEQAAYLLAQIKNNLAQPWDRAFAQRSQNRLRGLAVVKHLAWDSAIFNKTLWQIPHLLAPGSYAESLSMKKRMLRDILRYISTSRASHVSCKVDIADMSSVHALEAMGFRLMDTILVWFFSASQSVRRFKALARVRDFKKADLPHLESLARASFRSNRFHLDPALDPRKADTLYARWVGNYCRGIAKGDTGVKVAQAARGVAGFAAYRVNRLLEKTSGHKIIGRGLLAVWPDAKGAAVGLVNAIVRETAAKYDFAELDVLASNLETHKIYAAFGFKILRSTLTFHRS